MRMLIQQEDLSTVIPMVLCGCGTTDTTTTHGFRLYLVLYYLCKIDKKIGFFFILSHKNYPLLNFSGILTKVLYYLNIKSPKSLRWLRRRSGGRLKQRLFWSRISFCTYNQRTGNTGFRNLQRIYDAYDHV